MDVAYAVIFVSDMSRSVSFYRDVVGLPLKFESPEWTEFSTGPTTVALHRADASPTAADAKAPGTCRPGFSVPDLDGFHRRMLDTAVECAQSPRDVFGSRIAQYVDPDGLQFSVSESRPAAG